MRFSHLPLLFAAGCSVPPHAASTTVAVTYDGETALGKVRTSYASTNIDTASLYNNFDFTDAVLTQLTQNLAYASPTQLRIGGGAADSLLFTGVGGARGACRGALDGVSVCMDASYWDEINAFAHSAGMQLVFDLNAALRDGSGRWNASNARALFTYAASSATPCAVVAWQLGNEVEGWYKRSPPLNVSGAALAADYGALRALLAEFPSLAQSVYGPDACCEKDRPILADFVAGAAAATPPLVDALTVHSYPISRNKDRSCDGAKYTDLSAPRSLAATLAGYAATAAPLAARGVPLILGETATSGNGGCVNFSNTFVAGFTFMYELGSVAESGAVQLNRQDLAGWSGASEKSAYALLGPPGWSRGALGQPHPDYFTMLLFKHLVSALVLNSSFASADDPSRVPADFDAHVWCGRTGGGVAVLTYVNLIGNNVSVTLPAAATSTRRTEYILTSLAAPADAATPPPSLFTNDAFLNGQRLSVDANGALPDWFYAGRAAGPGEPIVLPPWSYGLLLLLDAGADAACVGCGADGGHACGAHAL